MKITYIILYS